MSLHLVLFERQMKLLTVSMDMLITYLIGDLPNEIGNLINLQPEQKFHDDFYIRNSLN